MHMFFHNHWRGKISAVADRRKAVLDRLIVVLDRRKAVWHRRRAAPNGCFPKSTKGVRAYVGAEAIGGRKTFVQGRHKNRQNIPKRPATMSPPPYTVPGGHKKA